LEKANYNFACLTVRSGNYDFVAGHEE